MIERVTPETLDDLLPLIRAYQQFYRAANIDDNKNRAFFSQFAHSNERGVQHVYRVDGAPAGFSTIYFNFSSAAAEPVAVLNDLFVSPLYRRRGIATGLIQHASAYVRDRGYARLNWLTQKSNKKAQRLYDSLGAAGSDWRFYSLAVAG